MVAMENIPLTGCPACFGLYSGQRVRTGTNVELRSYVASYVKPETG